MTPAAGSNGVKPNTNTTAASDPNGSTENSAGVIRTKIDRRFVTSHASGT